MHTYKQMGINLLMGEQMGINLSRGMRKVSILIHFFKYYQSNEICLHFSIMQNTSKILFKLQDYVYFS